MTQIAPFSVVSPLVSKMPDVGRSVEQSARLDAQVVLVTPEMDLAFMPAIVVSKATAIEDATGMSHRPRILYACVIAFTVSQSFPTEVSARWLPQSDYSL